jgi:putative RNA 2'-phosphotransferase
LLAAAQRARQALTREVLDEIVATSDKKRFAFSADGALIRANQGHSVNVELGLAPQVPPEVLYHGTAERFVTAILAEGLRRGSRHHVHLSADVETDSRVGVRHGRLVLFSVAAQRMHSAGLPFFCSDNGVWLAEAVPPEYLTRLSR